jgi:hypothetical protein
MRTRKLTQLTLGALLALALWRVVAVRSNTEPVAVAAQDALPQAPKTPATRPTKALAAQLSNTRWLSTGLTAPAPEEESVSEEDVSVEPTPLNVEELDLREAESAMLTSRWQSQQADPAWSKESEAAIAKLLLDGGFAFEAMRELDCRETVCRFMLDAEDGARALALLRIGRRVHDETWLDHTAQHDGSWSIEVFFARAGYRLSGEGGRIDGKG